MSRQAILDHLIKFYERVPYTVRKDSLDDLFFGRHKDGITEKVKQKMEESLPQIPPLVTDTFNVFYKPQPHFLNDSQIAPEFLVNKRVLEKVMKTDAFNEFKQSTVLDDVNSALATVIFLETLYQELKKKLKEMKEHTEKIQKLKTQLKHEGGQGNQQQVEQIIQQIQQHSMAMQNAVTQGAVSVAVRKAQRDYDDTQNALQALGFGVMPGQPVTVDPATAIQLATEIRKNRHIQKMIELLGRMRNLLKSTTKARVKPSRLELHSVATGRDLERLLPSEILKLRRYRVVFYKDYYENRLLHYELKKREREAMGPIVVVMDLSGSMMGEKEQWAKAVSLATIDQAVKEKRSWAIVAFDKQIKHIAVFKKPPKPEDILEIMKLGASGGTDFHRPLKEAMNIIGKEKDFTKADILFITDGDCAVPKEFLEEFREFKKRKRVQVMGVLISGIPRVIKKFSDEILALNGRLDMSNAEAVFQWLV